MCLIIQEEIITLRGIGNESFNHGFSYLFCTLHPVSSDLPPYLGMNVSRFLYSAWVEPDYTNARMPTGEDKLAVALSQSKDPLLRAIAYWLLKDYVNFEKEAIAGAKAGDRRMDSLALVAACLFSSDKKMALKAVEPILDRGVGLGRNTGSYKGAGYYNSSEKIRQYLEGETSIETLKGSCFSPR